METDGMNSSCISENFVNEVVSELTYFTKELHGAECPNKLVSLCLQQFLCSAYGPVHTLFSALIENKPRFCSYSSFQV